MRLTDTELEAIALALGVADAGGAEDALEALPETEYEWRLLQSDMGAEMPHAECAYLRGEIESLEYDPSTDRRSIKLERTWLNFAKDFGMHL